VTGEQTTVDRLPGEHFSMVTTHADVPGKTNPLILQKLVGQPQLREGLSTALTADRSPYVGNGVFDPNLMGEGIGKALKLYSESGDGFGLIGLWNIRRGGAKAS
jgi:hypothetical protein